jgi:hypothetical protein
VAFPVFCKLAAAAAVGFDSAIRSANNLEMPGAFGSCRRYRPGRRCSGPVRFAACCGLSTTFLFGQGAKTSIMPIANTQLK